MKLSLEIRTPCSRWRRLPRARALAHETIAACVAETAFAAESELCLRLTDDAEIQELNAKWRRVRSPTNVLSFPTAPANGGGTAPILGDIVVAYETAAREAEERDIPLADHYRHLVAHGFLHLIGYDHQTDEEAERMEGLERRVLAKLGVADPYASGTVEL
jgi:probable rRNA maturation factor